MNSLLATASAVQARLDTAGIRGELNGLGLQILPAEGQPLASAASASERILVAQDHPASIQAWLSPRDEAGLTLLAILTLGFIVVLWRNPKVSEAARHLWQCIFKKKIVAVFGVQITLGLLSGWVLQRALSPLLDMDFNYWKTTVEWLLLTAFPAVYNSIGADHKSRFLRTWLKTHASATLLVVFILSQYTFGFVLEFILLLCTTFLAMCIAIARGPELKPTRVVLECALGLIGLAMLGKSIVGIVADPTALLTASSWILLVVPAILSLANLPFAYALFVYSRFEGVDLQLRHGLRMDVELAGFAWWLALRKFWWRMDLVPAWSASMNAIRPARKSEVRSLTADVLEAERFRRSVPAGESAQGWNPPSAMKFPADPRLNAVDWHASVDCWRAEGPSSEVENGEPVRSLNRLKYVAMGSQTSASQVILTLYVERLNQFNKRLHRTAADATFFAHADRILGVAAPGAPSSVLPNNIPLGLWEKEHDGYCFQMMKHVFQPDDSGSGYEVRLRVIHPGNAIAVDSWDFCTG